MLPILEPRVFATGSIVALLIVVAWTDLSRRIVPDATWFGVALGGALLRASVGWTTLLQSVSVALLLFLPLLLLHARGVLGGGDVKLIVAMAVGLPFAGLIDFLSITALAGGALACLHLAMRALPRPALVPAGAHTLRRVYAAERWRVLRHGSLPYGVAIACGGVASLLLHPGG